MHSLFDLIPTEGSDIRSKSLVYGKYHQKTTNLLKMVWGDTLELLLPAETRFFQKSCFQGTSIWKNLNSKPESLIVTRFFFQGITITSGMLIFTACNSRIIFRVNILSVHEFLSLILWRADYWRLFITTKLLVRRDSQSTVC